MAHVRKQVRDWFKTNLVGSDDAGSRVEVRRTLPLADDFQPTWLVSIVDEVSEDISNDGTQRRTIRVKATAVVKGDSEAGEDTLDALGVYAEHAVAADPTLGGAASTCEYEGAELDFTGDGERTLCTASFTFAATVLTARNNVETAL